MSEFSFEEDGARQRSTVTIKRVAPSGKIERRLHSVAGDTEALPRLIERVMEQFVELDKAVKAYEGEE